MSDIRFGIRLLFRSPVFAITSILLLAVGIGANTVMFSVVDALLLRMLPVTHPENLVRLVEVHPNDFLTWTLPYGFCETLADRSVSLSEVICQGETDVAFSDRGTTERVRVHLVSPNFFPSLGVGAQLGRVLTAEDERTGALNAVLGYQFWRRRFAGDPSIVGRSVNLGGHAFTVVGVTPEYFNGLTVETGPDVRVPAAADRALIQLTPEMNPAIRRHMAGEIFGRLRPGKSIERTSREVDGLLQAYVDEMVRRFNPSAVRTAPAANDPYASHLRLESAAQGISTLRTQFTRGLQLSMAGVALLLLMACANLAGLLLARASVRAQEIGVRLAVGATPGRIVRQLLAEGLVLAVAGGAAGLLLAHACLPLVARMQPTMRDRAAVLQPFSISISINWRVLAFAAAVTLVTAVLFALSPALRCARTDVATVLRGGRTVTGGIVARNAIVAAQVALCTLVLVSAALLVETLERMSSMDPGFDRDHVVTFTIDPGLRNYRPEQSRALSKALLEKAAALPGVRGAAIAGVGLMRGTGMKTTAGAAGTHLVATDFLNSSVNNVTPGYFTAIGMQILGGRDFTWFDRPTAKPQPAIVNETFARRFFPGVDPIGRLFGFSGRGGLAGSDHQIIAVVTDAKYRSLREVIPPTIYNPAPDGFTYGFVLHLRTAQSPGAMVAPVRKVLRALDPELPIVEMHTLRQEVDASLWQERLLAWLSAVFGAIAAFLAAIGLYGALDYTVKSRTREMGVRMALGASPGRIVALLACTVALTIAGGLAAGLAVYALTTASLRRVLFDVTPWDPVALTSATVLLVAITAIGAAPAMRRAASINPSAALRAE